MPKSIFEFDVSRTCNKSAVLQEELLRFQYEHLVRGSFSQVLLYKLPVVQVGKTHKLKMCTTAKSLYDGQTFVAGLQIYYSRLLELS